MGAVSAYTPILQPVAVSIKTPSNIPYTGGISFFYFLSFPEAEIAKNHGMKSVLIQSLKSEMTFKSVRQNKYSSFILSFCLLPCSFFFSFVFFFFTFFSFNFTRVKCTLVYQILILCDLDITKLTFQIPLK